jgi:hypothetical protein
LVNLNQTITKTKRNEKLNDWLLALLQRFIQTVPWWGQCVLIWGATVIVLSAVGLFSTRVLLLRGFQAQAAAQYYFLSVPANEIPGIWMRWDASYYLNIAKNGYAAAPYAAGFFPLYPALTFGLSRITGMAPEWAAVLIAQLSYLAAILAFYKLARAVQDDHAYALRCVLALVLFPSSFFFIAGYAEPLTLFFSVLAVYWTLHKPAAYLRFGLMACLASATRPVGWLLSVVPVIEFLRQRPLRLHGLIALGLGLALSITSVVLFAAYLHSITDSWFAISKAQALWNRSFRFPWAGLINSLYIVLTGTGAQDNRFMFAMTWVDLIFAGFAIVMTALAVVWAIRAKFNLSVALYLVVSLLFVLSSHGPSDDPLWGMTRWVGSLFPIYLVMGKLNWGRHTWLRRMIPIASALMLLAFTAWWTCGGWIG